MRNTAHFCLLNKEHNKINNIRKGDFSKYKFISVPTCTGPYLEEKIPNQEYKELTLIKRVGVEGYSTDGHFLYIDKQGNLWFKKVHEDFKQCSKLQMLPDDILNGKWHKIKVNAIWLDCDENIHKDTYSIDIKIEIPEQENARKDLLGNIISINDRVAYAYSKRGGPDIEFGTIIKINDYSLTIKPENDNYRNSNVICYSGVIKIDK